PTPDTASVWVAAVRNGAVLGIWAAGAKVTGTGGVSGSAFGPPEDIPDAGGGVLGDIAIGPTGQVMVTYQIEVEADPNTGSRRSNLYVSVDPDGTGPRPSGAEVVIPPPPPPSPNTTTTNVGIGKAIPAEGQGPGIDAGASLAWDTSGGPHNGRVYLA